MKPSLDWNHLRTFLAIARVGKLTAAAKRLNLTHSTLSRHVSALEAALNTYLFERTLTGYNLTAQGERLLRYAEEVEATVLRIQTETVNEHSDVSGTVRIGLPDGLGADFLAPQIGQLTRRHPNLFVEIVATPRSFSLSRREADIVLGLTRPINGRVHARKLTDYELGIYVAADRADEWADVKEPQDLRNRSFLGYIDDLIFSPELDYLPQVTNGISPAIRSSNIYVQKNATIAGAGACVIPCFLAENDERLLRILPDKVRILRMIWMVVQSEMRKLARISVTTEFIAELARSNPRYFLPDRD